MGGGGYRLEQPLEGLPGITARRAAQFSKLGLCTVADLLEHYPRRHEDRRESGRFPECACDAPVCVRGVVARTSVQRWRRGRGAVVEVILEEPGAGVLARRLTCRWYNVAYLAKAFARGLEVVAYGRPALVRGALILQHPEFEVLEGDEEQSLHVGRMTPVYPATEGLTQRALRELVHHVLARLDPVGLEDPLPPAGLRRIDALRRIHFPETRDEYAGAREALALQEFLRMQIVLCHRRARYRDVTRPPRLGPGDLGRRLRDGLPFGLTAAQERALGEIRGDMGGAHPMHRLLHGEVGSGKTVVAMLAMLDAVEAGWQAALMAPTQVLAEQHYLACLRWLAPLGVRLALRTGARRTEAHMPLFDAAVGGPGDGGAQIVVGTHALLYERGGFDRLGLAVVDEQHKFGVLQRARLAALGDAPDMLVMTATPIPRTLAMTLYGDLDISTLDELPAGRGEVVTAVRDSGAMERIVAFLRSQLDVGRQIYLVFPLIEESDKLDARAAAAERERWAAALAPHPCELLHGRMSAEEKEAVMGRFRAGATRALVATTVIEVGIDVPNASVMVVFDADRFGLAQLHQLRGRIGRGAHRSWCILLSDARDAAARERLAILERTRDGFEIAEADLRMRDTGEILGTRQSGVGELRLGDLASDIGRIVEARRLAAGLLEGDPELRRPEHRIYRRWLEQAGEVVGAPRSG